MRTAPDISKSGFSRPVNPMKTKSHGTAAASGAFRRTRRPKKSEAAIMKSQTKLPATELAT